MNRPLTDRSSLTRSLLSIIVGLALAGLLIQISGYNALDAFSALWSGATGLQGGRAVGPSDIVLGSGHLRLFQLAQSFAKVTPLLFCGLSVALGLRAGLFNIGAQGQMTIGALATAVIGLIDPARAGIPPVVHILLALLTGAMAGAFWGALPGLLKAWRGVHEVISTIMLNFVGLNVVNYVVSHSLKDPHSQNLQTTRMAASSWLAPLVPHSNLTFGIVIALGAAVALTFLIARTSPGYAIRAVGLSPEAAEAAGISSKRILVFTMALSGALAGMAGAVEVMGIHHRYVDGVAGNYGFDGIAVALLGGLSGSGAIFSALFFGLLANGSDWMQSLTAVPAPIAVVVQAVVILFVGMRYRSLARGASPKRRGEHPVPPHGGETLAHGRSPSGEGANSSPGSTPQEGSRSRKGNHGNADL